MLCCGRLKYKPEGNYSSVLLIINVTGTIRFAKWSLSRTKTEETSILLTDWLTAKTMLTDLSLTTVNEIAHRPRNVSSVTVTASRSDGEGRGGGVSRQSLPPSQLKCVAVIEHVKTK